MCDPSKLAHEKKRYLSEWLDRAKSVQKVVPKVQQQLVLAKWEEDSLSDIPLHATNIIPENISISLSEDLTIFHQSLPEIPQVDNTKLGVSCATTSTTSAILFQFTDYARRSDNPEICAWGYKHSAQYEILQNQFGREQEVRSLLHQVKPELAIEFDTAMSEYRVFLAGTSVQSNIGIALRNVIEHYKGEIMNLARKHSGEQKITWQQMSERLVKNVDFARQRFQQQEDRWNGLQQRLSKIAKGHINLNELELRGLFTEFIDHLYIVLSLINIDKNGTR